MRVINYFETRVYRKVISVREVMVTMLYVGLNYSTPSLIVFIYQRTIIFDIITVTFFLEFMILNAKTLLALNRKQVHNGQKNSA